jgi:hypothetical protein
VKDAVEEIRLKVSRARTIRLFMVKEKKEGERSECGLKRVQRNYKGERAPDKGGQHNKGSRLKREYPEYRPSLGTI